MRGGSPPGACRGPHIQASWYGRRPLRDFVHVADVVRHLFAGMRMLQLQPQSLALNPCTGRGTTIRGLAGLLGVAASRIPFMQFSARRATDRRSVPGEPNEAIHVPGVEAGMELEAGLRSLFAAPKPEAAQWARRAPTAERPARIATLSAKAPRAAHRPDPAAITALSRA